MMKRRRRGGEESHPLELAHQEWKDIDKSEDDPRIQLPVAKTSNKDVE